jgi:MraZ protein
MIFLGTFEHALDTKNRLVLPSKFVNNLTKKVIISKGFDGCLECRSEKDFTLYSEKLMSLSQTKKDTRIVIRQLLANAADIEIDSAKRVLIPLTLLKEANISKDITIIGVGNKIEL